MDLAGQATKRQAGQSSDEHQAKRRSPTPGRGPDGRAAQSSPYPPLPAHHQAHQHAPPGDWASDPWAAAAKSTARSSTSYAGASGVTGGERAAHVDAEPQDAQRCDLRLGDRISA